MEFQIIVKGSFDEIQEVIQALSDAHQTEIMKTAIRSVTHVSRTTDPKPWDEAAPKERKVVPIEHKRPEMKKSDRKLNTRITSKSTGKKEHAPEDLQVHCHTCGSLFHPKFMTTQHCSKKCYMIEWYEVHKSKPDQPVDSVIESNVSTMPTPEEKISTPALQSDPDITPSAKVSAEKLARLSLKLKEYKETMPPPTKRPDITRDLV